MSRFATVFLLFMGLLWLPLSAVEANELGNPGFETVPAGGVGDWNTFAGGGVAVRSTAMPHSGSAHMDLEIGGPNAFAGVYQPLATTINPGDLVTFTGWQKSLLNPYAAVRELKIEWIGAPELRVDAYTIAPEYEQFMLQGVAPAGTTSAKITYAISSFTTDHQGEAVVYIDDFDVTIQRVPEPTTVMLVWSGIFGLAGLIRRR